MDEVRNLSPLDAARIEVGAHYDAPERTAASLRHTLRGRVLPIDPTAQTRRHKDTVTDRATWFRLIGDGMAEFGARLPAAEAIRCTKAVDAKAQAIRGEADERTADQRRADALISLVTGDQPPTVEIILRATHDQPSPFPGSAPSTPTPCASSPTQAPPSCSAPSVARQRHPAPTGPPRDSTAGSGPATPPAASPAARSHQQTVTWTDPTRRTHHVPPPDD